MTKLTTVVVEVEKKPYERTFDTISDVEAFIGGKLSLAPVYDDKVIALNEDAKILKLPENRHLLLQDFNMFPILTLGTFVVLKQRRTKPFLVPEKSSIEKGGIEWASMNREEVDEALRIFKSTSKTATIIV